MMLDKQTTDNINFKLLSFTTDTTSYCMTSHLYSAFICNSFLNFTLKAGYFIITSLQ